MNPSIVYLAQTDTTVGLQSKNEEALIRLKGRPSHKKTLRLCSSFCELLTLTRIPSHHKNRVRRSQKTTFIYPNTHAIRVVFDHSKAPYLARLGIVYSSSANKSGETFNAQWAREQADVTISDYRGMRENSPSSLIKLGRKRLKKLR